MFLPLITKLTLGNAFFTSFQNSMWKISKIDVKKINDSNIELVLALRMILVLSFVPESKVEIGFDVVIDENCRVASVT